MKIAWLQDQDIFAFPGGAEMNDAAHFREGLRRGHDLYLVGPQVPFSQPEALIVSNCLSFDRKRLTDMIDSAPAVFFFHDYIFCKYRLFYPYTEKCGSCDSTRWWLELFLKAKLLIWLSPLHRNATLLALPELENIPYALIPSAINPERFLKEKEVIRQDAYLSVNSLFPFKGRENIIAFAEKHPDRLFHIISQEEETNLHGNIVVLPPQTYDLMPKVYRLYKYYLELPATPQPFNRTCVEAKLSGCKIITNDLMGATSWPWFKEDAGYIAEELRAAPTRFWTAVERALK